MTVARARTLRRAMTEAEHRLWHALRSRRLGHTKFGRQVPLGPYVADFLSKRHRLVIEVDGGGHGGTRDAVRDRRLAAAGYRTLRLWNVDVLTSLDGVLETIAATLIEQEATLGLRTAPPPHPPAADAAGPSLSPLGRGAVRASTPLHQRVDAPLKKTESAPLPREGEREGPAAKWWEGEGR